MVYVGKDNIPMEHELRLSDAFHRKPPASLELVVKVKNCSNPELLPISGNCGILKEYCRFVEIVESTYSRSFPKSSFRRAIEKAMKEGVLRDYLSRKSREVINMLCAKYDYKMDIAVKQKEAFADGMEKGKLDAAKNLIKMNVLSPEQIAQGTGLPVETVRELAEEHDI